MMAPPGALASARGLSFDVDGTLYRVRRARVAWRLRRDRGLLIALLAAREKIRREPPLADAAALERREAELVAPALDLSTSEVRARLDRLRERLPEALCRGMRPYPGVRAALEAAAARGLRLATLSDFDPVPKLRYLGLEGLPWSAHVGAEALGALKPQPVPFRAVAEALGLAPSDVVHVGDRERLDVRGALGAGLRAWRFDPRGDGSSRAERSFSRYTLDVFLPLAERAGAEHGRGRAPAR